MGWFVRVTRFGSVHMVYGQEKDCSCGIASIIMINFKMKKGRIAAAASTASIPVIGPAIAPALTGLALKDAVAAEEEVYKTYSEVSGTKYDGSTYTWSDQLPKVMNKLGIGTWKDKFVGESGVAGAILDSVDSNSYPILLHTTWNVGGGGHFIVCDQVHDFMGTKYACICDPWNGDVVITSFEKGKIFNYTGKDPAGSWSIGGIKHSYDTPNPGKMSGWVIQRT